MYVSRPMPIWLRVALIVIVCLVLVIVGLVMVGPSVSLLPQIVKASPISTEIETQVPVQEVLVEQPTLTPTEIPLSTFTPTETPVVVAEVPTATPIVVAQDATPVPEFPALADYERTVPPGAEKYYPADDHSAPVSFGWYNVFATGKTFTTPIGYLPGTLCYFALGKGEFKVGGTTVLKTSGGTRNRPIINIVVVDPGRITDLTGYRKDNVGYMCVFQVFTPLAEIDQNQPDIADAITNGMANNSGNCGHEGCLEVYMYVQNSDGSFTPKYTTGRANGKTLVPQPTNFTQGYLMCYDQAQFPDEFDVSNKEGGAIMIYVYANSSVTINNAELAASKWYIIYGLNPDGSTPADQNWNWIASSLKGQICIWRFTDIAKANNLGAVQAAMMRFNNAPVGLVEPLFGTDYIAPTP